MLDINVVHSSIHRVEGAIQCGLDSPVEESDEDDEIVPDGFEAAMTSSSGWMDAGVTDMPPLALKHIHQFFISGRLRQARRKLSKGGAAISGDVRGRAAAESVARSAKKF